jgi:hypothetical protein
MRIPSSDAVLLLSATLNWKLQIRSKQSMWLLLHSYYFVLLYSGLCHCVTWYVGISVSENIPLPPAYPEEEPVMFHQNCRPPTRLQTVINQKTHWRGSNILMLYTCTLVGGLLG